jgi:REP element-mobilizing transposase RayT
MMPRANRYFLSGFVWHITHRCHKKEFLLKFDKDRRCWLHWLFEAKKRYGLCVLNYIVTSNHIHLLVLDTGHDVVSQSMPLIAGRTAQEFNQRKQRKGAFWEDRYHATAIQTDEALSRCLAYIDLNMVRAGVVKHPGEWQESGYYEIQNPPRRYGIVNVPALMELLGLDELKKLQEARAQWVESQFNNASQGDSSWTESIAAGDQGFVEAVKEQLGMTAKAREVVRQSRGFVLKETTTPYMTSFDSKKGLLREDNSVYLNES